MTPLLIAGQLAVAAIVQAPSDPITDYLRFELAVAQRNYLITKTPYDAPVERLQKNTAEAESACAAEGMTYGAEAFQCIEKPVPKEPQTVRAPMWELVQSQLFGGGFSSGNSQVCLFKSIEDFEPAPIVDKAKSGTICCGIVSASLGYGSTTFRR